MPLGSAAVGFDVALMDGDGSGFLFDDDIGILETLVEVAQLELEVIGNVGAVLGVVVVQDAAGADGGGGHTSQPLVNQGGVGLHGGFGVHYREQDFVVHLDEFQGFLGGVGAGGGYGGDGVAFVEGFAVSEDVVAEELVVDHRALGQFGGAAGGLLDVGGGDHGADAGMGGGPAGVNGLDAGVGVGGCGEPCRKGGRAG